tara:strand:- start:2623 stop:3984 length:1362 start_codon:yes stop_codon:yes gene_type:complete
MKHTSLLGHSLLILTTLLCFAIPDLLAAQHPERLPLSTYAALPRVKGIALSPDGQRIALIQSESGIELIVTMDLVSKQRQVVLTNSNSKVGYNWVKWANNRELLISSRFMTNVQNTKIYGTTMLVANADGTNVRRIIKHRPGDWSPQYLDRIVDILENDPDHILLSVDLASPGEPQVCRVNLQRNTCGKVVQNFKRDIRRWLTDRQQEIRIGFYRKGATNRVLYKAPGEREFEPLWDFESYSQDKIKILGFDPDRYTLYIVTLHDGRDSIFKIDVREPGDQKLIYAHPLYDVSGSLFYSAKSGAVIGIRSTMLGGISFWDPSYKAFERALKNTFKDRQVLVLDMDRTEQTYIVMTSGTKDPGTFYLGQGTTVTRLARLYPGLDESNIHGKKMVTYEASDGTEIEGFLARPSWAGSSEPLPTVIFPHGARSLVTIPNLTTGQSSLQAGDIRCCR